MKILVAIDLADPCDRVIAETGRMARALGARVCLLHVTEVHSSLVGYEAYYDESFGNFPDPEALRQSMAERFRREHQTLHDMSRQLQAQGVSCIALLVHASTNAVDTIIEQADRHEAGLIIVGSHGKGLITRILVGSTSAGVLHKAAVLVLVVPVGPA